MNWYKNNGQVVYWNENMCTNISIKMKLLQHSTVRQHKQYFGDYIDYLDSIIN